MRDYSFLFSSEREVQEFVSSCEQSYLNDVRRACELSLASPRIITLSGPTCSGKTTTALILDECFKEKGKELHTVSIDDFYFDREVLIKRSEESGLPLDYDSPSTIDIELFAAVVEEIEAGSSVTLPRFDFKTGKREGFERINIKSDDVFLFEGIQAVYPALTEHLKNHDYTALFISVEEELSVCGQVFGKSELRFLRRLVRDARTRGATASFTFSLWGGVLANEQKHIYPNLADIDYRINSMLPYEVSVIKPFVLALLDTVGEDSEFYIEARRLYKKLSYIPVIDAKFVPDSSVFREFIGERT